MAAGARSQPDYHATGRSAALFMPSYGTPQVRALTLASRDFLTRPPHGFSASPLLTPRGAMFVATAPQRPQLDVHWAVLQSLPRNERARDRRLSAAEALQKVPVLRPGLLIGAVYEYDAQDIEVHALHQRHLQSLRQAGGQLACNADVRAVPRHGAGWRVETGATTYRSRVLINAAGAGVDDAAALAGVAPCRSFWPTSG